MNYHRKFLVKPGADFRLQDYEPDFAGPGQTKKKALREIARLQRRLSESQFQLFAENRQSLLIILQAPDTAGKDGVVRHVFDAMNPQSCRAVAFKQPSAEELAHDFLWRIEAQTPRLGEVVVFNRSHYEDVLVVRVHELIPKQTWERRYEEINEFERRLAANRTRVVKFYLHISKEEQLARFKDRLDDPARRWKISKADYSEREFWAAYMAAYEEAIAKCSTKEAPWFVIPANRKWFRNLAISHILVDVMEQMKIEMPQPSLDLDEIRQLYQAAARESQSAEAR